MKQEIKTASQLRQLISENAYKKMMAIFDDGSKKSGYFCPSHQNSNWFVIYKRKDSWTGKMYSYARFSDDNTTASVTELTIFTTAKF